ncbi:MAG: AsnC family transcriptional regulator [Nanoarchaeota archaeon]|nr:AsnC family transcriptional regulator [Nanoarchaeota archaeon]MBU4352527.1 AsnC family transcriptional regulator [Nanoarchaeota archaeon]MBU4456880.1 AsnC family transcriptional regulator [Nanoarchaeota archaeon]MCG2719849.1 AsnC family transcriptional regulator [Nanoarchaeota archaeon]
MVENIKTEGWSIFLPKERKEIKLDKKDQRIIQTLVENCRTPLSTISKMTNLSKNSIINRINKYENGGLITGYSTFINIQKLNFEMFTIGIKTKMTLIKKEEFIQYLKKVKFLNQIIVLSSSRWDFMARIYAKNGDDFDKIITSISSFPDILIIDIMPSEDWEYKPVNYFDADINLNKYVKREDSSFQKTFMQQKELEVSFDKEDLEILSILSHNAKISLVELGKKLNLSGDTMGYRIKNLIKRGLIESFFANINPFLLGYSAYLINFQIFNRKNIKSIITSLANHPKCTGVLRTKTSWNIITGILFRNIRELKSFEEAFFTKFGEQIHSYEFIQILEQPHYKLFLEELLQK